MNTGVMQEIRERLNSGLSSGEVIAQGYASSTVFKVQRKLRQNADSQGTTAKPAVASSESRVRELETEIYRLRQIVESLEGEISELDETRERLAKSESKAAALELARNDAVESVEALTSRVQEAAARERTLEAETADATRLRQEVAALHSRLRQVTEQETAWQRKAAGWEERFAAEQTARANAENQWTAWESESGDRARLANELRREIAELKHLRVWAGHPCKVCHKPMAGAVARESAARVMQQFGHKDCLKEATGSTLGIVAAAAGLYGLSKLR